MRSSATPPQRPPAASRARTELTTQRYRHEATHSCAGIGGTAGAAWSGKWQLLLQAPRAAAPLREGRLHLALYAGWAMRVRGLGPRDRKVLLPGPGVAAPCCCGPLSRGPARSFRGESPTSADGYRAAASHSARPARWCWRSAILAAGGDCAAATGASPGRRAERDRGRGQAPLPAVLARARRQRLREGRVAWAASRCRSSGAEHRPASGGRRGWTGRSARAAGRRCCALRAVLG